MKNGEYESIFLLFKSGYDFINLVAITITIIIDGNTVLV
jgi:hypothetical protein